jgi:hypothetical protein
VNINNLTKNTVLAEDVIVANTYIKRMIGLLTCKQFKRGQALILRPCNQIHTLFMRFSIDVLFLNQRNKVIAAIHQLKPWRISPFYLSAHLAIELPAGTLNATHTAPGDILCF